MRRKNPPTPASVIFRSFEKDTASKPVSDQVQPPACNDCQVSGQLISCGDAIRITANGLSRVRENAPWAITALANGWFVRLVQVRLSPRSCPAKWRSTRSPTRSGRCRRCSRCWTSKNAIAAADAMHTAELITGKGGNCVLALKGDQGSLHKDAKNWLEDLGNAEKMLSHQQGERGHGRDARGDGVPRHRTAVGRLPVAGPRGGRKGRIGPRLGEAYPTDANRCAKVTALEGVIRIQN